MGICLNKDCGSFAYGEVQGFTGIPSIIFYCMHAGTCPCSLPHNPREKVVNGSEGIVLMPGVYTIKVYTSTSISLWKVWYKATLQYLSANVKGGAVFFGSGSFILHGLLQIALLSTVFPMMAVEKRKKKNEI